MLCLVFHLGADRYGLDTHRVERVLPLLEFKRLPGTPAYVAGLANYHGRPVPVIDLSQLACATPAPERLDTRLVLVRYPAPSAASNGELLGLIAERVTGVQRVDEQALCEHGVDTAQGAPYLGRVASANGMLQLVTVEKLLPESVRAQLFARRELPC